MKSVLSIFAMMLLATWWVACKKNTYNVTEREEITNKALVKLGYFAASVTNQPVQAKINGVRVSPTMPYNTPFPGGGLNTGGSNNSDFLVLAPGANTITLSISKVGTETDSVKVFEEQFNFEPKRQTVFFTDSFPNIQSVLVSTESPPTTDSGKARIKFVNLMPDAPAVDFYRGSELLKANIAYKESTEFFDIYAGNANYVVKLAGSSTNIHTPRAIAPAAGRIYVFLCRGYKSGTGVVVPHTSAVIIQ